MRSTVPDEVCSDASGDRTVVRFSGLHPRSPDRIACQEAFVHSRVWVTDSLTNEVTGEEVALPRQAGDWHQLYRKPRRGRGVLPPQHEQEAGRRVAEHQASGKVHHRERAEVLRDCDSYSFFYMNITTSSGFQEHAASWNSGSKIETNLRLGPEDLVQHLASREEAELDRILIWMIDMQKK